MAPATRASDATKSRRPLAGRIFGTFTPVLNRVVSRIAGKRPVFLCKMDIEGAELPIFAAGDVAPFEQIEHLVVEVHGGVEECGMVTRVLSSAFPQLETITRPTSSKPLLHAWRPRPAGAATTSA